MSEQKHPDPVLHRNISFAKSLIRIAAGVTLCLGMLVSTGILIIIAEMAGILEELV